MPAPTQRTEHDLNVIANAVAWTRVRGRGHTRTVSRHATHNDALLGAILDGRTMIYAIDDNDRAVHVENV